MRSLLVLFVFALSITSCSKCYECQRYDSIEDGSGNIVDSTVVSEEVCTADNSELDTYEDRGYNCD